ncbi:hypothetical protein [Nitrosospira sp. Nsp1]|uniref:hypothetical protein n=1 Tax=Nitrosospira sp. Nsp1 TaxID=136547 RepID=UPI001C40AB0C|nr:hypothetical protein [Nitrosospira sp. Nsp1]
MPILQGRRFFDETRLSISPAAVSPKAGSGIRVLEIYGVADEAELTLIGYVTFLDPPK